MVFYAQLNESNICIGISILKDEVNLPNMIEIPSADEDYRWRKYENGEWSEEKFLPSDPEPLSTLEEQIYAENLYQTALLEMQQMLGGV